MAIPDKPRIVIDDDIASPYTEVIEPAVPAAEPEESEKDKKQA